MTKRDAYGLVGCYCTIADKRVWFHGGQVSMPAAMWRRLRVPARL